MTPVTLQISQLKHNRITPLYAFLFAWALKHKQGEKLFRFVILLDVKKLLGNRLELIDTDMYEMLKYRTNESYWSWPTGVVTHFSCNVKL